MWLFSWPTSLGYISAKLQKFCAILCDFTKSCIGYFSAKIQILAFFRNFLATYLWLENGKLALNAVTMLLMNKYHKLTRHGD